MRFAIEKPIRTIDRLLAKHRAAPLEPALRARLRNAPKHVIEDYYFETCARLGVAP